MDISVLIANYNYERYLARAVRSCLDQTMPREAYEIIVIDDASVDKSLSVLSRFHDEIVLIVNEQNKGLGISLNRGLSAARGQYVVRVDADDYVERDFLRILWLFLAENYDAEAAACDYFLVEENGRKVIRKSVDKDPIGCGVMFRHDFLFTLGYYASDLRINEDKELMSRFEAAKGRMLRVPLPLYRYTMHEESLTHK